MVEKYVNTYHISVMENKGTACVAKIQLHS